MGNVSRKAILKATTPALVLSAAVLFSAGAHAAEAAKVSPVKTAAAKTAKAATPVQSAFDKSYEPIKGRRMALEKYRSDLNDIDAWSAHSDKNIVDAKAVSAEITKLTAHTDTLKQSVMAATQEFNNAHQGTSDGPKMSDLAPLSDIEFALVKELGLEKSLDKSAKAFLVSLDTKLESMQIVQEGLSEAIAADTAWKQELAVEKNLLKSDREYVALEEENLNSPRGYESHANPEGGWASGDLAKASGANSTAFGTGAEASGDASSAVGHQAKAGGAYSSAFGQEADASGVGSSAHGYQAMALGDASTAQGAGAMAVGDNATAVGAHAAAHEGGTAIGSEAQAGMYAVASGKNASAAQYGTAVGTNAQAAEGATATGTGARAEAGATAYGMGAEAAEAATAYGTGARAAESATAYGTGAYAAETATAVGQGAHAEYSGTAIGTGAYAQETATAIGTGAHAAAGATAIGTSAIAIAKGSVAIGDGVVNSEANTVAFANGDDAKRLTHVADGKNDTDAVNVRQARSFQSTLRAEMDASSQKAITQSNSYTDQKVGEIRKDMKEMDKSLRRGIASSAALMMSAPYAPGKVAATAGTAVYRGSAAIAVGASYWDESGTWNINGGVSTAGGNSTIVRLGGSMLF